jgi:RNA polymerase sigma factor (sigma-70 family)
MSGAEREAAIREMLPLVRRLVRRVRRLLPAASRDELTGDGCVGLIRAVDTFDDSRGIPLEQYAARVVVGAMLNGVRRMDPVPERIRREVREADRERHEIAAERCSWPSQIEMETRRPRLRRAAALANRYTPLSLDGPLPPDERVAEDWSGDPAGIVGRRARTEELQSCLMRLPHRQRRVVALHYFAERSLHQIGDMMEISPQRASQLHVAALKRLRHMYAAH